MIKSRPPERDIKFAPSPATATIIRISTTQGTRKIVPAIVEPEIFVVKALNAAGAGHNRKSKTSHRL
jgi:hypothetical protein